MKRAALALLLALPAAATHAEWVLVGSTPDSDFYIDPGLREASPDSAAIWVLYDLKAPHPLAEGVDYSSSRSLQEFNCDGHRYRTTAVTAYAGRMGNGEVVGTDETASEWMPVAEGSTVGAVMGVVCGTTPDP